MRTGRVLKEEEKKKKERAKKNSKEIKSENFKFD